MLVVRDGTFEELQDLSKDGAEGMVFFGCGGDLQGWLDGVVGELKEQGLASGPEVFRPEVIKVVTLPESDVPDSGGRTDLAFIFADNCGMDFGRLAIVRLTQLPRSNWLSDFVVNYAEQYGIEIEEEEEEDGLF